MKIKSLVLVSVAIGCGLVAMLGVQQVLSNNESQGEEQGRVLVAATEISPNIRLDDTNTVFKQYPLSMIREGAVTKDEEFEIRGLRLSAVSGEVIMLAKLGQKGVFGASNDIPDGMRVVTVSVDLTKTHSGLIMPSDRVDILVTYKTRKEGQGMVTKTKTVLEFVKVFATDSIRHNEIAGSEAAEINAKNISLLVTPEQANLLMLVESKGKLHLALRPKFDDTPANAPSFTDVQFDEEDTLIGEGDEDESAQAGDDQDVKTFLENQSKEPIASKPVAEEKQPETPKWQIVIFAGDERRVEEVDLPQETADAAVLDSNDPRQPQKSWKGLLQKFFTGA